jgi:ribosome-associated protein
MFLEIAPPLTDYNSELISSEDVSRTITASRGLNRDSLPVESYKGGPLAVTARVAPATVDSPVASKALPSSLVRAKLAAKIASEDKGQNILVLDMRGVTPMYDFFVIATGASKRQVHAIVEDVDEAFRKVGDSRIGLEGYEASKWVVQDYGDVMLHVFDTDTRAYYQLEDLWNDAERIDWESADDAEYEADDEE